MCGAFTEHQDYLFLNYIVHNLSLLLMSIALTQGLLEDNRGIAVDSVFTCFNIHFPLPPKLKFLCIPPYQTFENYP